MLWRGPQRRSGIFFNLEVPVPPKRHKKAVSGKEWKRGVPSCSIFWGTYGVRLQKRTTWQSQRSEELLSQEDGDWWGNSPLESWYWWWLVNTVRNCARWLRSWEERQEGKDRKKMCDLQTANAGARLRFKTLPPLSPHSSSSTESSCGLGTLRVTSKAHRKSTVWALLKHRRGKQTFQCSYDRP